MHGVSAKSDLKSAALLAGAYGVLAAFAAVLLMPLIASKVSMELPMPLPVFAAILAVQLTVVYGLLAWAGLRMARTRGLDPTPSLAGRAPGERVRRAVVPGLGGLACGAAIVLGVRAIQMVFPGTLPAVLHPPGFAAALGASIAAAFGEEILCRLFLLSLVLRVLPREWKAAGWMANVASAIAFGVLHVPGMVAMFGGLGEVPRLAWAWVIGLNAMVGVVFGWMFVRRGVLAAIGAHWCCDLVWHVASAV